MASPLERSAPWLLPIAFVTGCCVTYFRLGWDSTNPWWIELFRFLLASLHVPLLELAPHMQYAAPLVVLAVGLLFIGHKYRYPSATFAASAVLSVGWVTLVASSWPAPG